MTKKKYNKPKHQKDVSAIDTSEEEYSSINIQGKTCQHVARGIHFGRIKKSLKSSQSIVTCSGCLNENTEEDPPEVWLCLQCGYRGCGRMSENKHALQHFKTLHSDCHSLVLSTTSGSVWCYDCDDEISLQSSHILKQCVEFVMKMAPNSSNKSNLSNVNKVVAQNSLQNTVIKEEPAAQNCDVNESCEKIKKPIKNNKEMTQKIIIKGLRNLGNTCFFNAVMQNLNQTSLLYNELKSTCNPSYLWEVPELTITNNQITENENANTFKLSLLRPFSLTNSLLNFLEQMSAVSNVKVDVINPSSLFGEISKKCPQFRHFQQQDSHELLRQLLDGIRQEEIKRQKKAILRHFDLENVNPEEIDEEIKREIKAYGAFASHTIIEKIFGGLLISTVLCEECKMSSQVFEPFMDLSLPLFEEKQQESSEHLNAMLDGGKQDLIKPLRNKKEWDSDEKSPGEYTLSKPKNDFGKPSKHQEKKQKQLAKKEKKKAKITARNRKNSFNELGNDQSNCQSPEANENSDSNELKLNNKDLEINMSENQKEETLKSTASLELAEETLKASDHCLNLPQTTALMLDSNAKDHEVSDDYLTKSKRDTVQQVYDHSATNHAEGLLSDSGLTNENAESTCVSHNQININNLTVQNNSENTESAIEFADIELTENHVKLNDLGIENKNSDSVPESTKQVLENNIQNHMELKKCVTEEATADVDPKTFLQTQKCDIQNCVPLDNHIMENSSVFKTSQLDLEDGNIFPNSNADVIEEDHHLNNGKSVQNEKNRSIEKMDKFGKSDGISDLIADKDVDANMQNSNAELSSAEVKANTDNSIQDFVEDFENHLKIYDSSQSNMEDRIHALSMQIKDVRIRRDSDRQEDLLNSMESADDCESQKTNCTSPKSSIEDTCSMDNGDSWSHSTSKQQTKDWISKTLMTLKPRHHVLPLECSINSCLSHFTKPELLTGNNKFRCENCTEMKIKKTGNKKDVVYSNASKQLLIFSPPAVLTLHLKRFQQVGMSLRKVNRFVEFPLVLDLAPFCCSACTILPHMSSVENEVLYSLYGIVEHSGRLTSGHYTAYVKANKRTINRTFECQLPLSQCGLQQLLQKFSGTSDGLIPNNSEQNNENRQWYYISDSHVKEVSETQVLKCQAYLLFYERIK